MSIEADITAFFLIYTKQRHQYVKSSDVWVYECKQNNYRYIVDNFHEYRIYRIIKVVDGESTHIHSKADSYKERDALEIIVSHWKENERI